MDPRVKTPAAIIAQTHATGCRTMFDAIARDSAIVARADAARNQLREARSKTSGLGDAIDAFDAALVAIVGQGGGGGRGGGRGRGGGGAAAEPTYRAINAELSTLACAARAGRCRTDDAGDDGRSQRAARLLRRSTLDGRGCERRSSRR
jgi:hypothetical protein